MLCLKFRKIEIVLNYSYDDVLFIKLSIERWRNLTLSQHIKGAPTLKASTVTC